jgi:hypothetical protein
MDARSLSLTARELILQEKLAARAAALPDDRRRVAAAHLETARARHLAGESLVKHGEHTEAARAFADAIAESLLAADAVATEDVRGPADAARVVLAEVDKVARVTFLADASRAHQALYEAVAPYTLDTRSLRRAQLRRAAAIVAYAVFGVYLVLSIVRRPATLSAEASGSYSATFFPSKAIDGDPASEWLLPDRTTGWIDIELSPPRPVKTVRLLNARNIPYNDRATGQYRVESFFKGTSVFGVDDAFAGFNPAPTAREVTLDGQTVDHIKVFVKSWHEGGAGFAEITIE